MDFWEISTTGSLTNSCLNKNWCHFNMNVCIKISKIKIPTLPRLTNLYKLATGIFSQISFYIPLTSMSMICSFHWFALLRQKWYKIYYSIDTNSSSYQSCTQSTTDTLSLLMLIMSSKKVMVLWSLKEDLIEV